MQTSSVKYIGIASLFAVLASLCLVIPSYVEENVYRAIACAIFVGVLGSYSVVILRSWLSKSEFMYIAFAWQFKLLVAIFILLVGWLPELNNFSSLEWGYDPQRYYFQSQQLVENNWVPDFLSLNYIGILYYYGVIYYLFGHNPFSPLMVNSLLSLIAFLLVYFEVRFITGTVKWGWLVAVGFLFPEIIWYDLITSRESPMLSVLTITVILIHRIVIFRRVSVVNTVALLCCVSFVMLVRTTMLAPIFICLVLAIAIYYRHRISKTRLILYLIMFVLVGSLLVTTGFKMSTLLGGSDQSVADLAMEATTGANLLKNEGVSWSENSIGSRLLPTNAFESIFFVFPRVLIYLVTPLQSFSIDIAGMTSGSWIAWQSLLTVMSSFIYVAFLPVNLAVLVKILTNKIKDMSVVYYVLTYWVFMFAIGGGNLIIHERYRVMAAGLFVANVALAFSCLNRSEIVTCYRYYGFMLFGSALLYLTLKVA